MNKLKRERMRKRLFRILGTMVAMCLMLTSIGVHLIFAENKSLDKSDLIPGSITIDSPKELSKVSLPANSYGTLKWKDGSAVPSSYSSSYEVIFTAAKECTADFSKVKGFDNATRTVTGTVTVYVKSLAPAVTETPAATETPVPTGTPEATETPTVTETPAATETPAPTGTPEVTESPTVTGTPEATETPAVTEAPEADTDHKKENVDSLEKPDEEEPYEEEQESAGEENSSDTGEEKNPVEETEPSVIPEETPAVTDTPEVTEIPESPMELVEEEVRPDTVSEDMTYEEQAAAAALNHSSQGITVSADFLPWYVQFRVSDGSGFAFTNAEDASTFQAYEFKLWDLLNDTEYIIPEGETVQVTMPAISGYEYTIQHIRPDGSVETIIPDVYGDTMVFTTSSFSPFGIAGSKPLVGGDIADNGYGSGNSSTGSSSSSGSQGSSSAGSSTSGTNTGSSSTGNTGNSSQTQQSSSGNTGSSSVRSNSTGSQNRSNTSSVRIVKTGDSTNIMPIVLIGIVALVVILAVVFTMLNRKRK